MQLYGVKGEFRSACLMSRKLHRFPTKMRKPCWPKFPLIPTNQNLIVPTDKHNNILNDMSKTQHFNLGSSSINHFLYTKKKSTFSLYIKKQDSYLIPETTLIHKYLWKVQDGDKQTVQEANKQRSS